MYDPETARTADIEMILSMASMLVCGEEEAQAGLLKYQEQWTNDSLDLPGLQAFMSKLYQGQLIAKDMLKDISALMNQAMSRDYNVDPNDPIDTDSAVPKAPDAYVGASEAYQAFRWIKSQPEAGW